MHALLSPEPLNLMLVGIYKICLTGPFIGAIRRDLAGRAWTYVEKACGIDNS